jgi:glutamyl-tRNA synthetase
MTQVRVRFAPSPTGFLHIGGARTALYNWLFKKKHGGTFVLRIEDTDVDRSTTESADAIVEGLRWMGIDWEEGPYLQSKFLDQHKREAHRLLDAGAAYRCFCTKEELAEQRQEAQKRKETYMYNRRCAALDRAESDRLAAAGKPFALRLNVGAMDGEEVSFDDEVYGHIEVNKADIDDFVIVRSNGMPLYNFANVIDDHRDRITHVIRGADGLTNTPKQLLVYRALGWRPPTFAHMALTLDPKKAKISKRRHGEVVTVAFYRQHGFLPWAFCNFMALLGWSAGDDREIYRDPQELIAAFSLDRISKANSVFNYRKNDPKFITDPKALVINGEHLRQMALEDLFFHLKQWFEKKGLWDSRWENEQKAWFLSTVDMIRERYHTLEDFTELGRAYFSEDYPMANKALKNMKKDPRLKEGYRRLAAAYERLEHFDLESTEQTLRDICADMDLKAGLLINGTRAAVTGQPKGPSMFHILVALGKKRVVKRLRWAAEQFD